MNNHILRLTEDGSHTIELADKHVTYHSTHGAIQESRHVFIEAGLGAVLAGRGAPAHEGGRKAASGVEALAGPRGGAAAASPGGSEATAAGRIDILEMGFGTGLNALLSLQEAIRHALPIYYEGVELYPLSPTEAAGLNYPARLGDVSTDSEFYLLHAAPWNEDVPLHPFFTLHKREVSMTDLEPSRRFHLIYYDAFAPGEQPELWTRDIFEKMRRALHPGGILVTYCSKGSVRRAMVGAGFQVEKLPGPPGKKEMLRAKV